MGLNPFGVFVWKLLDGKRTLDAILNEVRDHAGGLPGDVEDHIRAFVAALVKEGLAGFYSDGPGLPESADRARLRPDKFSDHTTAEASAQKTCTYEPPKLVNLKSRQAALGEVHCGKGSNANPCCDSAGNLATSHCYPTGNSGTYSYSCSDCATNGHCYYNGQCACTGSCYGCPSTNDPDFCGPGSCVNCCTVTA